MKKIIKFSLIVLAVLVSLYALTTVTGVLTIYTNTTVANEPALKLNSKMVVSNLIKPKVGDFVSLKVGDSMFGKNRRVFRLCGTENDWIEIKDGVVFLNEKNIDENLSFTHRYLLTLKDFQNLKLPEEELDKAMPYAKNKDSVLVLLEDTFARQKGFEKKRIIDRITDTYIKRTFAKNWNKDNFGPIRIPKGKVFVLGDNRDNSEDSRYIGFIDESAIVGTVIN